MTDRNKFRKALGVQDMVLGMSTNEYIEQMQLLVDLFGDTPEVAAQRYYLSLARQTQAHSTAKLRIVPSSHSQ